MTEKLNYFMEDILIFQYKCSKLFRMKLNYRELNNGKTEIHIEPEDSPVDRDFIRGVKRDFLGVYSKIKKAVGSDDFDFRIKNDSIHMKLLINRRVGEEERRSLEEVFILPPP